MIELKSLRTDVKPAINAPCFGLDAVYKLPSFLILLFPVASISIPSALKRNVSWFSGTACVLVLSFCFYSMAIGATNNALGDFLQDVTPSTAQ